MPSEVIGLESTLAKFNRVYILAEAELGPALKVIAEVVRDDAKVNARRDTGRLIDSVEVGPVEREGTSVFVKVGPTKKGWYGHFLEFGTRLMGALPFLRPARDKNVGEVKSRIRTSMAAAIGRV